MTPNCIDVSTWQRDIDWQRVKDAGIKAVIIRAGFGHTKDNQFENHYAGARAAGLAIGAYWYSYAYSVEQGESEAYACAETLKGKTFEIPVYYDMEEDDQMTLGKSIMTALACRFLDTLKALGYRVGMYSSPSWFTDFLDYDLLRAKYSIWLAHWASRHTRACDIWQYGEDGSIDGVPGDVDVDIIENWDVIGGKNTLDRTGYRYLDKSIGVLALKEMLLLAKRLGITSQGMQENTTFGDGTQIAVNQVLQKGGYEQNGIAGEKFIKYLAKLIRDKLK